MIYFICHLDDSEEGLDGVADNHGAVLQLLLVRVAVTVDDLHLLHDGRLARLARPQQQQLDLPQPCSASTIEFINFDIDLYYLLSSINAMFSEGDFYYCIN